MRKWHRWISLLTSIIMGFIALTGLLLQLDLYASGTAPPAKRPPAVVAGAAPSASAPRPATSNKAWIPGFESQHYLLQDLHAGYFMGHFGRAFSMLMALGLLTLSITGIVMYVQLYKSRKRLNRHGLFWK